MADGATMERHAVSAALAYQPRQVEGNIDADGAEVTARSYALRQLVGSEVSEVVDELAVPWIFSEDVLQERSFACSQLLEVLLSSVKPIFCSCQRLLSLILEEANIFWK
jgi:hypothetical protein